MSENWSTWIIGHSDTGPLRKSPQISFCYYSVSQLVQFLAKLKECRQGAAYLSYHTPPQYKIIRGLGRTVHFVSLEEILEDARLSTFTGVDSSDFSFVPCGKKQFPVIRSGRDLFHWSQEQNLPYVHVHDNDHAFFCSFPRRLEKHIFVEFLKASVFNIGDRTLHISRKDWTIIRRGVFEHGYTLNRSLCSYAGGILTYVLWAGIPSTTLLESNPRSSLSTGNEKLVLTVLPNDELLVKKETGKCPLKNDYGEP